MLHLVREPLSRDYKGKLKNAIILQGPPSANVQTNFAPGERRGQRGGPDGGRRGPGRNGAAPPEGQNFRRDVADWQQRMAFRRELTDFMRTEGAACIFMDSGKPQGLLNMTGSWRGNDRISAAEPMPSAFVAHEHYAMLYRLASRPSPARTRVELEMTNKIIPGPIKVFNTVGEILGIRIMCGFPIHLKWRKEIDANTLLGPRLVVAGPIIDGPNPVWPDSLRAATNADGRVAVHTIREAGYDCVKVYHLLPRDAYFGVAAEARSQHVPLVGHVPFDVSAAHASDMGQKSIEHLSGVALACSSREEEVRKNLLAVNQGEAAPPRILLRFEIQAEESYDVAKAAALFACFVKNGTWHVPTLAVRQSHASLQEHLSTSDARCRYLPASLIGRWDRRRAATFKKLGPEDFANFKATLRNSLKMVNEMHKAGVRFLAGTDTGALDCYPGSSLHEELELLVHAGLTPLEALQAATRNSAEFLVRADDLGTVQRGKLADLVLLDANPLDDIRNVRKINAVIARGRLFSQSDLRQLLADVEAACRRDQPGEFGPDRKIP
jgi:Amidohydrolase family